MPRRAFPVTVLIAALLAGAAPARARTDADSFTGQLQEMRVLDGRVAAIGHRLAVSSLDLCADREWLPGFSVHHLSQYGGAWRDAATRAFGLGGDPGVLALVPGGPAERAGLRVDDLLLSADGVALAPPASISSRGFGPTELILDRLGTAFADGEAVLALRRGAEHRELRLRGVQGCATRFQIVPSRALNALADGRYVQLSTRIVDYAADDQELAAILAHEFAHNVLRHRVRLDAAGVRRGFLGNFGRNAQLIRETEVEADRLSVYLLDRAGFDPAAPIRFWSRFGRRGLNLFGTPTHPNWRRRIALFQAELDLVRAARAAGRVPVPSVALPASGSVSS